MKPSPHPMYERTERQPNGCLLWMGYRMPDGYGQVGHDGKVWLAHRLSWTLTYGPIPEGMQVCHRCDTPPCIEPTCFFLCTNAENSADKQAKGRATSWRADQTHCIAGHEYTPENTLNWSTGRRCRTCRDKSRQSRGDRPRRPEPASADDLADRTRAWRKTALARRAAPAGIDPAPRP